jgi:phospholipid/cholesterol/gamma-HCH transport system ATP-binding protein
MTRGHSARPNLTFAATTGTGGREPIICMRDVYKSFGRKIIFAGINFDLYQGETVVVMGPSGIGKSVLLRHIVRLTRADSGVVRVLGRNLDELNRAELYELRLRIGVLFQSAALLDSMSVEDNVLLGLRNHTELPEAELQRIAAEKLMQVGLPGIGSLMPAELSGGMRKRVGLARAIAMEPDIVLYDEPTTGLDPVMSDVINELIIQAAGPDRTSIVVTHDMTTAFKVGTRFLMLLNGNVIFDGGKEALRSSSDPRVTGFIAGKAETLAMLT